MASTLRKTRFVCVSDTHNASPINGAFKLPRGDVLIHAGDLTNQGSLSELRKTVDWMEKADFEAKIVIAGNHDITLDTDFYGQHGLYFHNQYPQDPRECLQLLVSSSSIKYLNHQSVNIRLIKEGGPQTTFKIFGSPYSPARGLWAFGYPPERAPDLWDQIPLDADIIVTHTPPKFHCDESSDRGAAGCEILRQTLWRVRPRLHVCGHVHEGRGVERVIWDLSAPNVKYKEENTGYWNDPGRDDNKQSSVDLTAKGGAALDNDGSHTTENSEAEPIIRPRSPCNKSTVHPIVEKRQAKHAVPSIKKPTFPLRPQEKTDQQPPKSVSYLAGSESNLFTSSTFSNVGTQSKSTQPIKRTVTFLEPNIIIPTESAGANAPSPPSGIDDVPSATRGQGGIPTSRRSDVEALYGRMGRRETCVINAAIMASSWPHKGSDGKKYNKPVIVDIDLPVWAESASGS